jgi:hypothetical protein
MIFFNREPNFNSQELDTALSLSGDFETTLNRSPLLKVLIVVEGSENYALLKWKKKDFHLSVYDTLTLLKKKILYLSRRLKKMQLCV